jgi:hypothetical protein
MLYVKTNSLNVIYQSVIGTSLFLSQSDTIKPLTLYHAYNGNTGGAALNDQG